jgi:sugar lactone lactonase YvrE
MNPNPVKRSASACVTTALLILAACGGGDEGGSARSAPAYALGGTVSGLDEGYVDLRNGLDVQRISANPNGLALDAPFTFDTSLPAGVGYNVQIVNDPQAQFGLQCELAAAQGTMPAAAVTSVVVRCARLHSVRFLAGAMTPVMGRDGLASQVALDQPSALATDAAGNLYVAEDLGVRRITPTGVVSTVGTTPLPPKGIAVDSIGSVYTTAHWAILRIRANGSVTQFAGEFNQGGHVDGTGTAARFNQPTAMAMGAGDQLHVLDSLGGDANYVRRIDRLGAVSTLGSNIPGDSLRGLALDAAGNAYTCQVGAATITVLRVNATTATPIGSFTPVTPNACRGMAIDAAGRVLLTDGDLVRTMTPGSASSSIAGFGQALGLAFDGTGRLFASNSTDNTIRTWTSGGTVTPFAGVPHTSVTPTGEGGSADGNGAAARFSVPRGVALDLAGNVYVADSANHTVRRITPLGVTTTLAGSPGQPGHVDATGSNARFSTPTAIAVDTQGNVFVTELGNRTLRRITPAGVVTTVAGHPQNPVGSLDGVGTAAGFTSPIGLTVDPTGTAWVVDGTIVREVSPAAVVSTVPGLTATGPAVAIDSRERLYVGDVGTLLRRTRSGAVTRLVLGDNIGTVDAIAVGPDQELWVVNALRNTIYRLDAEFFSETPEEFTVTLVAGRVSSSNMELGPLPGTIGRPRGIAANQRRVYFASDNAILFLDR